MLNLIYVHIGTTLPECFLDNIYQTILTNNKIKIYVLLDDSLIPSVRKSISQLNKSYIKNYQDVLPFVFVRNSLLEEYLKGDSHYIMYKNALFKHNANMNLQFRDGFWVSTTKRFFYLQAVMNLFYLDNVFHIENDVMLNESLINIYDNISDKTKIVVVKDSHDRVIPSIVFIPDANELGKLNIHIAKTFSNSSEFVNDMALLASFNNYNTFNIFPDTNQKYIYDGAAIGQYLDGVDIKNLNNLPSDTSSKEYKLIKFRNPTKGFINETSLYKPNSSLFYKKGCYNHDLNVNMNVYLSRTGTITNIIPNIHVHSKQLYKFSGVFDLKIDDVISGDKVVGLCDFVISTQQIVDFHKNLENFISLDKIIMIKDFNNINYKALNNFIKSIGKKDIKLFIYTHLLKVLVSIGFFDNIDSSYNYILYVHNSDHVFDNFYKPLLDKDYIKFIYAQNINIELSDKAQLLPIGLANSMWPHGDMIELYDVMKDTYLFNKIKNIYININPNTYGYRLSVLNKLKEYQYELSQSKPYRDYLVELSQHYFCLCVRGNGIDTHRFWEALYLGVIPVIINNEDTDCNNYVKYLYKLEIPFFEIRSIEVFENKKEFFNESLYNKIICKYKTSLGNLQQLKIAYYNSN